MEGWVVALPAVNASLNALSGVLLAVGYALVKRRRLVAHRRVMVAACCVSIAFLVSYLTYHTLRQMEQGIGHTRWVVEGWLRSTYYTILLTHVVLAATVPPLAIWAVALGYRRRYERHRRVAKVTWPIWMYVSVTGVIVYFMLYHLQPALLAAEF